MFNCNLVFSDNDAITRKFVYQSILVMTTKITLTIESGIIETAKAYAVKQGSSLSNLVEDYLKNIAGNTDETKQKYNPIIKELLGAVPLPTDFNYKDELGNEMTKKYSGI